MKLVLKSLSGFPLVICCYTAKTSSSDTKSQGEQEEGKYSSFEFMHVSPTSFNLGNTKILSLEKFKRPEVAYLWKD